MTLQIFLILLTAYGCLAQVNAEDFQASILNKINSLTDEVQFLKRENSNKEIRIQVLEGKVNIFQLESQLQKDTIQKLSTEVEILQNQINETTTDIQEQTDPVAALAWVQSNPSILRRGFSNPSIFKRQSVEIQYFWNLVLSF